MHVLFGEGMELDAHIDVLVTAQRMRLILLPTRGMPGTDAVIVEDFLFERAPPAAHRGAVAEQRSALEAGLGDVLSVQAPLLGAGAGPISRCFSRRVSIRNSRNRGIDSWWVSFCAASSPRSASGPQPRC